MATVNSRIQLSADTETNWTTINPTLKEGEPALVKKSNGYYKLVVGDIGGSKYTESVVVWDELSVEEARAVMEQYAANALASQNAAKASQTAAKTSETNAKTSETNAAASASTASSKASAASTSAANAKTSETNAKTSETNAKASETAAKASQTEAASSASSASTSATNAANSATLASNKATAASTSATNAANSATTADNKASAAATSATEAEAAEAECKKILRTSDMYLYVGDERPADKENLIYINPDELEVVNWGDAVKSVNNVVADGSGNVKLDTIPKAQALDTTNTAGMQALVDFFYPVGTVYACTGSKPAFMSYGTWEAFAEGRTLVGAGTGTDENGFAMTFTNGATGGEYKHTLTTAEMPAHTHTRGTMEITASWISADENLYSENAQSDGAVVSSRVSTFYFEIPDKAALGAIQRSFLASRAWTGATSSTGGGSAHSNTSPYTVVRFYRRIS